jgi:ribonucleoside-diphosphate reductase alpha chain
MENITFENVRPLSQTAKQILNKRYMQEGEKTWDELVDRVMNTIVPKESDDFLPTKEMISHRYFLPNSPCLANAGKEGAGLCACYVVDFKDTTEGIIKTKADFIYVARKGGGCGTSLSKLRPKGSIVAHSSHGYAGGPVGFADTISHDMKVFTQGGLRGMAIMFTMSVYHPDVIDFIQAKQNEEDRKIENANMSVVVDNRFMELVKADAKYWTEFNGVKYKEYNARDIFNLIIEGAWRNGEPGLLFQDAIDNSPYMHTGQKIQATNPCSEQPLPPNGVCNLGSLDLSKFVGKDKIMDFSKLEYATRLGTRFLDRVVDKSVYPTPEISEWAQENRAIGMGIMGFADYCLMRQIAYGSEQSILELDYILFNIYAWTRDESEKLGKTLGVPKECRKLPAPRRNITITTVAPTGTVSLIAGCSSGIEPIFSEITIRNDKTGTYVFEDKLADKPYFRCAVSANGAQEVTWEEHVSVLATAQKNVDSGVSKTINFPTMTHRDTISKAVFMAWEKGCKGIAVYRNGSRKIEVLTPKNIKQDKCPNCETPLVMIANVRSCPSCGWKVKIETEVKVEA